MLRDPVTLAEVTTLRLGGPAARWDTAHDVAEVAALVAGTAGRPDELLVLGGGSNLVVADAGIPGRVVRIAVPGVDRGPAHDGTGADHVTLGAGLDWDAVVAELTADGYAELAPLSGIPGSVGATPVQNVGAYGTEIADLLVGVTLVDRATGAVRQVPAATLQLGYRSSVLRGTDSAVVVDVTFRLTRGATAVRYAELARRLGVEPGGTAPADRVREAVLELRRGKGMVLDPDDPDTWSAGSFFTNPIVPADAVPDVTARIAARTGSDEFPRYPAGDQGAVKLSAAWLIERAGFRRGHPGPGGRVSVSTKHTLALTNRGDGTTADLLVLAREIRDGVRAAFGVDLHPEPVLVGVALDGPPPVAPGAPGTR